jgi:ATP-dependent Clp protease adapter protein ClpS
MGLTAEKDVEKISNIFGKPYNVILFNDDVNPFDAVVLQIIKATKCLPEKAMAIALEAHTNGKAVSFTGYKERCEVIESILSGPPLKLMTSLEPAV